MYLFDSILSAHEGLPTFVGTELQGLPATSPKSLWQAQARSDWDRAYNIHLAEWMEHGLSIDELWSIPTDLDDSGMHEGAAGWITGLKISMNSEPCSML